MDDNQRFEINRRIIGKTVFITTHGGFYAEVIDVNEDTVKVRHGEYFKYVSIFDLRDPDYF